MSDVLAEIVNHKRQEVAQAKVAVPLESLQRQLAAAPAVRDFVAALRNSAGMGLIAEVKKASPSAGVIRDDFNPRDISQIYERHGAACISCLTDEKFFQGSLDDLRAVRKAVDVPVLRKDFLIDRYQVLEARTAGADCILLIAEILDDCTLRDLYFYASELGMECLIEIYDPDNLERVLKLDPPLLGVNNRNLKTFQTELGHSIGLIARVPKSVLFVSESGIHTRADVCRLQEHGVQGILVGETLMRADDIGAKVDELLGVVNREL